MPGWFLTRAQALTMAVRRSSTLVALTLVLVGAPSLAFAADELGKAGVATKLELSTTSADQYLKYHGRVTIGGTEYRWGGSSCGSRTLAQTHVDLLVLAVRERLEVTPRYQVGPAKARCLVGLTFEPPKRDRDDDDDRDRGRGRDHDEGDDRDRGRGRGHNHHNH